MRPESYADCRNDALKPITADGLRAFTPHFILEPFIFGTVFEPISEIAIPVLIKRLVL